MISRNGVRRHDHKDANNEAERKGNSEPGVILEVEFTGCRTSGRNGATNKGDKPCQLQRVKQSVGYSKGIVNAALDGCEGGEGGQKSATYHGD
jgi:hypothetical protein